MTDVRISSEAQKIHSESIVFDAHIDTATHLLWRDPDFSQRLETGNVDIPRLKEGGVDAAVFAVWEPLIVCPYIENISKVSDIPIYEPVPRVVKSALNAFVIVTSELAVYLTIAII